MAYQLEEKEPVSLYSESKLRIFATEVLLALGASQEEAEIVADGITTASLWWHPGQGQGMEKLFRYQRRVQEGGIVANARMEWLREGSSYALLDAANGFGYVAAYRAMHRAIEKASQAGIGMVGVHRSNHFGIAGYHAMQATKQGLIGWAFTNARAEMAPWGSAKPVLGTNPWGIAIPRKNAFPVVLDMALTMSGKGMMRWYQRAGKPIPDNWALAPDGTKTTDPGKAMEGPVLPIGEYKGYGLSFITDVLTGVMTGSLFGMSVFQDEQFYNVGHMMLAINPDVFIERHNLEERLEALCEEVKSAPPIEVNQPIMLPGEAEHQRMQERRRNGIPIDQETVIGLRKLAADLNVVCPL